MIERPLYFCGGAVARILRRKSGDPTCKPARDDRSGTGGHSRSRARLGQTSEAFPHY
jgi:hypothetical protein